MEFHRLRIRIKKLRYASEFFGGFWPGRRTNRYLSTLKDLQQVPGAWHDVTVAQKLIVNLKTSGKGDATPASAAVDQWLVDCGRHNRKGAIKLWGRFARRKVFWEET